MTAKSRLNGSVLLTVSSYEIAEKLAAIINEEFVDVTDQVRVSDKAVSILVKNSRPDMDSGQAYGLLSKIAARKVARGIRSGKTKFAYRVNPIKEGEDGITWMIRAYGWELGGFHLHAAYDNKICLSENSADFEMAYAGKFGPDIYRLVRDTVRDGDDSRIVMW